MAGGGINQTGDTRYTPQIRTEDQLSAFTSATGNNSTAFFDGKPIPFIDVYDDIVSEMVIQPNLSLVKSEVNKIIHRINDELGMYKALFNVTIGNETKDINQMTSTNIESLTTLIQETGRFSDDFTFDSDNYILRIPDYMEQIYELYVDDETWEYVPFEAVRDASNASQKIYHITGRYIFFPKDLSGITDTVRVKSKIRFSKVQQMDGYSVLDAQIYLPYHYRMLIVSGVIMNLSIRQKYKDMELYTHHKEVFAIEYSEIAKKSDDLETPYENYSLKYTY